MSARIFSLVLAAGGLLGLVSDLSAQPRRLALQVAPEEIEIGILHDGFDLSVSADAMPDLDLVAIVAGPVDRLTLRKKARVWGLFWAPADEVTFDRVPSVYLMHSTAALSEVASDATLERHGIGYSALRPGLGREGQGELFDELVRLKELEGLFRASVGPAASGEERAGRRPPRTLALRVPANAPPAEYSVRLLGFRGGELDSEGYATLQLRKGAPVAFLSSLAEEHSLLYGIFAVVAALAAGLLVGLLFGKTRKR